MSISDVVGDSTGTVFLQSIEIGSGGNPTPSDFTASINWGDGTASTGTIVSLGNNFFNLDGAHTYTEVGTYQISLNLTYLGQAFGTINPVATVSPASPTLTTTVSPGVSLSPNGPVTLSDSAVLAGGFDPTGSITFTLSGPGGFSYSQTDTVSDNGTYAASTTLPTSGTVAGTYTWSASYGGDDNNDAASDQSGLAEQTIVSDASPTLTATASPGVSLSPNGPVTLSDSAVLAGGFDPTGSITFTLSGPGGFSYSQTDTVSDNGTYAASTTLPTSGTVAGTYTWSASYGGDDNNDAASDQSGLAEQTIVSDASPTLTTTVSPDNVTLSPNGPVTLSDSAVLAGGFDPTGSITFTLSGPGGFSYSQTDTVSDNGTYAASTTLPTSGTVAGTYTWSASYGGDDNNDAASDQSGLAEQTIVSDASPTLTATASPGVSLSPNGPVTLSDSAVLAGGFDPTGSITFTLSGPGGFSYSQTDTVSDNGTYAASTTLPTSGTVAGTYTWSASYGGDDNNDAASDQSGLAEQTIVSDASPTLTATASPGVSLSPNGPVTLSDSAVLAGGFDPTGSITFTLSGPGGFSYSQTDTVSDNGTYAASTTLPTSGTVAGTYTWSASYGGDDNNDAASDQSGLAEQTIVSDASPTLTTTVSPDNVTLSPNGPVTLSDSAVLAGGFDPTGSITFTLSGPGGFSYSQIDTATGNAAYSASATLPTSGMVAGTFTWSASYGGDANNDAASDQGGPAEQTIVAAAIPTLTTSNPGVSLANGGVTLSDTADLEGAYSPTGTITFTLTNPSGATVDTETVAVAGDGTYSTPSGYTLSDGTAIAGAYSWVATYSGDANNTAQTASPEQTTSTPTITAPSSSNATASQTFVASSLFTAGASLPILTYEVEDESRGSSQGFWVLNGAVLTNGQLTTLSAAQLSELSFVAGASSTPVSDTLEVAASDAAGLGAFATFAVTAAAHAPTTAPTVAAANELQAPNLALAGSNLFSGTAFGGNTITSYEVEDTTADSGHWVFNGVVEPTNQVIDVTAAQLSQLSFDTGYGNDTLKVRANDGSQWGNFTTFTVMPPPNAAPPAGTEDTLVMSRNTDGAIQFYDIGQNFIQLDGPLGQINPALQVAAVGGFNGADTADLLMRDPTTGVFTLYDVSNDNITGNVVVGQVGLEWTVAGFGDFSGHAGETDMLMRNSNSGVFEVYDIANNAIAFAGPMGQVGLEWQVVGFGDFSSHAGETDMLMRNSNTGAFEVFDISNNTITSSGQMGQVGLEWQVAGFGDFSAHAGETDMLMRNSNTGAFEVYDIVNNAITSFAPMGQVGLEWSIAGFGDFTGHANETDMLMRNDNSGAFMLFDISNNTITGTAPMGQVGLEWSISGVSASPASAPPSAQLSGPAVDPATAAPSSATAQLTQAMASFLPSLGASDFASSLALMPTPQTSNPTSPLVETNHPQAIS